MKNIGLRVDKFQSDLKRIDNLVNKRIIEAFAEKGCDIWFTSDPKIFLGDDYNADEYEKVFDID